MFNKHCVLLSCVFALFLSACGKYSTISSDSPVLPVKRAAFDSGACLPAKGGTGLGITPANLTGIVGVWEVDSPYSNRPATEVGVNDLNYYVITPDKNIRQVSYVALNSSDCVTSSPPVAPKSGDVSLGSDDKLTIAASLAGSDLKLRRVSDGEAKIDAYISLIAQIPAARASFIAKWKGKDLALIKKTVLTKGPDGATLTSKETAASEIPDTEETPDSQNKKPHHNPKHVQFLDEKKVLVDGTLTTSYLPTIYEDGRFGIVILEDIHDLVKNSGNDVLFVSILDGVAEETAGGLKFDNDVTQRGDNGSIARHETIVEFSSTK